MIEMSMTMLYVLLLLNVVDCAPDKTSCTYKSQALSYHVAVEKCEASKAHAEKTSNSYNGQILACVPVEMTNEEIKNLESK